MGYYDNVKDSIRDENDESNEEESSDSSDGINGNFDTLKEAAEETQVEDDEGGDGTPIEVLEEDGLKQEPPSQDGNNPKNRENKSRTKRNQDQTREQKQTDNTVSENSTGQDSSRQALSGDTSDLENKLDKIIEQNSKMIEILESFGN